MEVHVLSQRVLGAQSLGADGANERLLSGVDALVNEQRVLLGETVPTDLAPERLLS